MDKQLILAVAGSGKTTELLKIASKSQRSLIVTYTNANYENIINKLLKANHNQLPDNIRVLTYFKFLYNFCYKPFLSDRIKAKYITFEKNPNQFLKKDSLLFYMDTNRMLYSNRIAKLIIECNKIQSVKNRIAEHYDNFMIDEIQDVAGNDFNLVTALIDSPVNVYFVGDFYQHNYDTSRDNNVNRNLHKKYEIFINKFSKHNIDIDTKSLNMSHRCGPNICKFISDNFYINMIPSGKNTSNPTIEYIDDDAAITKLINNRKIIKLFYQKAHKFNEKFTWGSSKGMEFDEDICVVLNNNTDLLYKKEKLSNLQPKTKNKLYVALTRTKNNVYLVSQKNYLRLLNQKM